MKRTFMLLAIIASIACGSRAAVEIPLTTQSYDVVYHWGIINKVAGHGVVSYHTSGRNFYGQLEGHSIPWDGRIYTVESSLNAVFSPRQGKPSLETITAMQGTYTKPLVGSQPGSGGYKNIYGGGTLDASPETMEAVTVMTNMLSMFYYAHEIDFASFGRGEQMQIPIMKSGQSQALYITSEGVGYYSYNGYSCDAYEITFQYTYNGAPDRYPVHCWINTSTHLPVKFSADLLIGHIEMCYVP